MKESVKRGVKCHREKNKHNGEASLVETVTRSLSIYHQTTASIYIK